MRATPLIGIAAPAVRFPSVSLEDEWADIVETLLRSPP